VYAGPDLAAFGAGLRHRVFHGFGRLLAQFVALPLELSPCLFPRLRRQHLTGKPTLAPSRIAYQRTADGLFNRHVAKPHTLRGGS